MDSKSMSSRLRDLVKFLSSVQGDLSNITAPPFFLASSSVVEVGHCWSQRPAVFAAPSRSSDPEERALLVLRLILIAMRSQFYIGGSPTTSIKKPLNAFLGEVFLAQWRDEEAKASTSLVAEQVSHHPPITAMHMVDKENGVRADGYARVEMTFNTSVDIRQVGHAVYRIDKYDEDYLIPLPDVKVRGFLNGRLYPEVVKTYSIVGSNGYVSEITFSGAGFVWGKKNSFSARMYHKSSPETTLYEVSGIWSHGWTVRNARTDEVVEKYLVDDEKNAPMEMEMAPLAEQCEWESRRAWSGVIDALDRGDFRDTVAQKTRIEQAQRKMRQREKRDGETWEPLFFESWSRDEYEVFDRLSEGREEWCLEEDKTSGVWRVKEGVEIAKGKRKLREGSPAVC